MSAEHARRIARANGAPKGTRRERQTDLVHFVADQIRLEAGLKPVRWPRARQQQVQQQGRAGR